MYVFSLVNRVLTCLLDVSYRTFDCVTNPAECPCPAEQDVKCMTGHGESYVCVRGDNECQKVNQAKKAI